MKASTKVVVAAILVSLLLIVSVIFANFGKEQRTNQKYRSGRGEFARTLNLMNTLNHKEVVRIIDERLPLLIDMENIGKKVYIAELELKEELEKSNIDEKRIKDLLDDIYHLEDVLSQLTLRCNLNVDRLFPELRKEFIGRGPVMTVNRKDLWVNFN